MAGDKMPRHHLAPDRFHLGAVRLGDGTAGVEAAAGRRVNRAGHVAGEDDALAFTRRFGIGHGNGR